MIVSMPYRIALIALALLAGSCTDGVGATALDADAVPETADEGSSAEVDGGRDDAIFGENGEGIPDEVSEVIGEGGDGDAVEDCVPVEETCNGLDDDCDGTTDGAAAARSCRFAYGSGTCLAGSCIPDVAPLPRIEVTEGVPGGFRRADTGADFIPRGNNYVRIGGAGTDCIHTTFRPATYDAVAVESALAAMERDGYNAVRVFIEPGQWFCSEGIGGPRSTRGLDGAYLDAVADFVQRAARHHVYVVPVLHDIPYNDDYNAVRDEGSDPNLQGWNARYMHPGHIEAKRRYVADFIDGLIARVGPDLRTTILAYELENEAAYETSANPFALRSGMVTTADGRTYDMAVAADRQQAADSNAVRWATILSDEARAHDAGCLVTVGLYTYRAVGKPGPDGLQGACRRCDAGQSYPACDPDIDWGCRYPVRAYALTHWSRLSFLDVHTYPMAEYALADDLASLEWSTLAFPRPIVMGEFGAFKSQFPSVVGAAFRMRDHQIESCSFGFRGWLFWTYDSAEQPELWNALDERGAINGVLAPVARPDPCS